MSERTRPMTLALAAVLGATLVSGGWMLRRGATGGAYAPVNGVRLFQQVATLVQDQYVDSVPNPRLYGMSVDGFLAELDDPYDAYIPPDRLKRLAERTAAQYAGIGLEVDMRDGSLVVVNPLPNGPGERAGIVTGDRIVQIDGRTVSGWTPEEARRLLRGPPGSVVTVAVERPGSVAPDTVRLTRAVIHEAVVRHPALVAPAVGYVAVGAFSDSTVREVAPAIDSLVRAGAASLVLDLRANPGGLLAQGVATADLFLNAGQVVASTRGRRPADAQTFRASAAQRWPRLRLAVLVDDKTASAAEVVAGALQDHDRAVVIGQPTYGKGSVQHLFPVADGGAIRLTTALWYTPAGRSIARTRPSSDATPEDTTTPRFRTDAGRVVLGGGGITPDVVETDTAAPAENVALMRALGTHVAAFRDALASFALDAKAAHRITAPDFAVTPAMLDDVYRRMQARGVDVPRPVYDEAAPLVRRLLAYEVERYVFGAEAEFRRKASDDRTLQDAIRLLASATSQRDALARAAALARARAPAAE